LPRRSRLLAQDQGRCAVFACFQVLAEIPQKQAGIGKEFGVYPKKFTSLAQPLLPASQEVSRFLVSLQNPGKHRPLRQPAMRFR
jgi:hypothetical protein